MLVCVAFTAPFVAGQGTNPEDREETRAHRRRNVGRPASTRGDDARGNSTQKIPQRFKKLSCPAADINSSPASECESKSSPSTPETCSCIETKCFARSVWGCATAPK